MKTLTREQEAKLEVGRTDIDPRLAKSLSAFFIVIVLAVPLVQTAHELMTNGPVAPQFLDAFRIPQIGVRGALSASGSPLSRLNAGNKEMLKAIVEYESVLDETSWVGNKIRRPAQEVLVGALRAGNEDVYCGTDGWLFFRPAIDHLTGTGFLSEGHLKRRAASGNEWTAAPQPDPRVAILQFRDQLAERGIQLIVAPIPVKASIQPERFSNRYQDNGQPIRNETYHQFLSELTAAGVTVFDSADLMKQHDGDAFLKHDSHWRPEVVADVARGLANLVRDSSDLPELGFSSTSVEEAEFTNRGDLVSMLEVPSSSKRYTDETVRVQQVVNDDDTVWQIDPTADVLVLGDSFANIYSLEGMGWGESGGLMELLSHELQRPLDGIVRNDSGAYATRNILARELARGRDRLSGKRLVIWEFTERELSSGDWRLIPMSLGEPQPSRFVAPPSGESWDVTGTIAAKAPVPRPRSALYADYIVSLHLTDLESSEAQADGGEALVFVLAMDDYTWTEAARFRIGQKVSLRLSSWYEVDDELQLTNRGELFEGDLMFQEPCWGEEPIATSSR